MTDLIVELEHALSLEKGHVLKAVKEWVTKYQDDDLVREALSLWVSVTNQGSSSGTLALPLDYIRIDLKGCPFINYGIYGEVPFYFRDLLPYLRGDVPASHLTRAVSAFYQDPCAVKEVEVLNSLPIPLRDPHTKIIREGLEQDPDSIRVKAWASYNRGYAVDPHWEIYKVNTRTMRIEKEV